MPNAHDWMEADAVCPFFRRYRRAQTEITCDPPDEASMIVTALRFRSAEAMLAHYKSWCCSMEQYQLCPVYKAAAEQYDDKDRED